MLALEFFPVRVEAGGPGGVTHSKPIASRVASIGVQTPGQKRLNVGKSSPNKLRLRCLPGNPQPEFKSSGGMTALRVRQSTSCSLTSDGWKLANRCGHQ